MSQIQKSTTDENSAPPTEQTPLIADTGQNSKTQPHVAAQQLHLPDEPTWRDIWRHCGRFVIPVGFSYRVAAVVALTAVFAQKVISLLPPLAMKRAIDVISMNAAVPKEQAAAPLLAVLAYFVARAVSSVVSTVEQLCRNYVQLESQRRFSIHVFDHLQSLSLSYHISRRTGEITRIMDRGVGSVSTVMNVFFFTLAPTLFETILVTAIFFKFGTPLIALSTFGSVACYIVFTVFVTRWRTKYRRLRIDADNAVSDKAFETLINYETVSIFGRRYAEVEEYSTLVDNHRSASLALFYTLEFLNAGQHLVRVAGLSLGILIAVLGTVRSSPRLTAGDVVLISSYIGQLFQPLAWLGSSYRMIVNAFTDLEKVTKLLQESPDILDAADAEELKLEPTTKTVPDAEILFENVSFAYKSKRSSQGGRIKSISFRVTPGKMLGIVGPSGCGKSTVLRLILRLYDVDHGRILINGKDVRRLSQMSLRNAIGTIAQETVLFNDTLRFNIGYGKMQATDAEVWEACKAAALHEFIENLDGGLDTKVGERGMRLSGGERQRVGAARCLIKRPAIVLLDEATSALDTKTERQIQENMAEICKGRTTIVVAHRLSTVMHADEILVLGDGTVRERGNHEELIALGGRYAEMWKLQTDQESSLSSESE